MPVEVQVVSQVAEIPCASDLQCWAEETLRDVDDEGEPPELCIRVVDDQESRELNARYRGVDKPTNVLGFAAEVNMPGGNVLGDIVICAPVVQAEAAAQGKIVADHFAHMVVHGVLHLKGFDHHQRDEAELMESTERRILNRIGVADPY